MFRALAGEWPYLAASTFGQLIKYVHNLGVHVVIEEIRNCTCKK